MMDSEWPLERRTIAWMRATSSARLKGLSEVVVRTAVESRHAVLQRIAGGQDQHGRLQAPRANGTKNFQAIAARKAEVEEDGVERFGIHPKERGFACPLDDNFVFLRLEPLAQGVGDLLLVLDDQDPHLLRSI